MYEKRVEGCIIIRLGVGWYEYGEKNFKYFCNLIKFCLSGVIIINYFKILKFGRNCYENFFKLRREFLVDEI